MPSLIFCVEPGILYSQAVLLAESVIKYTDNYFDRLLAFSPRKTQQLNADERLRLSNLGVQLIDAHLNTDYLDYPIANKILACCWAEKNLANEQLVMVDSDTIFLQPPVALKHDADAFMRPVDRPGQASLGPDSKHEAYWQQAYKLCQTPVPSGMTRTGVNRIAIRPYYNAGFVAYNSASALGQKWLDCLDVLRSHNHHPNNPRCLDQVALAIITAHLTIGLLPDTYNYPIPLRSRMLDTTMQQHQMADLIHVHYHRWFQKPGFFELLNPKLKANNKMDWLLQRLPLNPVIDDPFPH